MSRNDAWDVIKGDVEEAKRESVTMEDEEDIVHSVESRGRAFYIVRLDTNQAVTDDFFEQIEARGYREVELLSKGEAWTNVRVVPNSSKSRELAEL